jgi:phage antirepressor YoqD-like protein
MFGVHTGASQDLQQKRVDFDGRYKEMELFRNKTNEGSEKGSRLTITKTPGISSKLQQCIF